MRKLFTERARLVIYLEQSELDAMAEEAKQHGQTLQEWARGELQDAGSARTVEVQIPGPIRVEKPLATMRIDGLGLPERCPHKKAKGELCYKCDPKFGLPQIT